MSPTEHHSPHTIMEHYKSLYNRLVGAEAPPRDAALQDWYIQHPFTMKPDLVPPHQLLMRAVHCYIDGSTLAYKSGITEGWQPIASVEVFKNALGKLEAAYEGDTELQKALAEVPGRPELDNVPVVHQHTTEGCEL